MRVSATAAARSAIARLRAAGTPLMFVQSAGCCAGSVPMCFPDGEYVVGAGDRLLGEIDGCPFYIEARLDEALGRPDFVLDVEPGPPEGFSLAAPDGNHFVTRAGDRPAGRAVAPTLRPDRPGPNASARERANAPGSNHG